MNHTFTPAHPKHAEKFLSDSISNPTWFPRYRDGCCIGWMQRKFFCSCKEVRNNLRLDQQVMGWQHSFQTKADIPKISDCCCSEKSGFRPLIWLTRIFYRGKMLKGTKCLFAVLRDIQRRKDGGSSQAGSAPAGTAAQRWRDSVVLLSERQCPAHLSCSCC